MKVQEKLGLYRARLESYKKARDDNNPWATVQEEPTAEQFLLKNTVEKFMARRVREGVLGE
jgi:hypothetical protein